MYICNNFNLHEHAKKAVCDLFVFAHYYNAVIRFSKPMITRLGTNLSNLETISQHLHSYKNVCNNSMAPLYSIKLHLTTHIAMWTYEYGPLLHLDTARFESYLKEAAKKVYRRSVKRKEGMIGIMTDKVSCCMQ